jgi:hypothetical protein
MLQALNTSFMQLDDGPAFAHGESSAWRFEPGILHMSQGRAGARSHKTHMKYVFTDIS